MSHFASPEFWYHYRRLPAEVRAMADAGFTRMKADPQHPGVRLKKVGRYWTARIGLNYRAVARERAEGLNWFWIGPHDEYDKLIRG